MGAPCGGGNGRGGEKASPGMQEDMELPLTQDPELCPTRVQLLLPQQALPVTHVDPAVLEGGPEEGEVDVGVRSIDAVAGRVLIQHREVIPVLSCLVPLI